MESLNGGKTRPLTPHALGVLKDIARQPVPQQEINPGVRDRLHREHLVEDVELRSPYAVHKGGNCTHLKITEAGLAVLKAKA
ncbi:hypothetical protein ABIC83_002882 [Roseateles asaccharophilus]|uniref:hypothetical protein n=1 Tax=Roseateles asaccharophilus TaxID=582607 RepID=UPI0038348BB6